MCVVNIVNLGYSISVKNFVCFSEINSEYSAHGVKVVEFYKNSPGGLINLEKIWREHFVTTMQPKYLPDLWSMDHTTERLTIRATEGRIGEGDLRFAGLGDVKIDQ